MDCELILAQQDGRRSIWLSCWVGIDYVLCFYRKRRL